MLRFDRQAAVGPEDVEQDFGDDGERGVRNLLADPDRAKHRCEVGVLPHRDAMLPRQLDDALGDGAGPAGDYARRGATVALVAKSDGDRRAV